MSMNGKIPPQAVDIEKAVLGAVMLEKDAIIEISGILKAESFYKEAHQKIFQAIIELSANLNPIDVLTVTEQLRKNEQLEEVGGPVYITYLTSNVASSSHVEFHACIIAQKYIQREFIRISTEIQKKSYDDSVDVDDLIDFSESELFKVSERNIGIEPIKINVALKETLKQIDAINKNGNSGIPSGYKKLDCVTSGWQKTDLILFAARPSMGKTAFMLSMARNMAIDHNVNIGLFSLEMSTNQLVTRLISFETGIDQSKLKSGNLNHVEWEKIDGNLCKLHKANVYIDDMPSISVFQFRAKARRLVMKHGVKIIFIDYLQLMRGDTSSKNREQEVSSISRSLKGIAKELDIPIIALSQLNRSVEMRSGSKRPQLSDLRESGAIEQDADIVLFIHRPEKYGFLEDEEGNSLRGLAEIIIAKHRNGPLADIELKFIEEQAKFIDLNNHDDEYNIF